MASALTAKAGIPASKIMRKGKAEDALTKEIKKMDKMEGAAANAADFSGKKSMKSQMKSVANPLSMVNKVTGQNKQDAVQPLYFPGAKNNQLRKHANVRFEVFRVDSPDDVKDPIKVIFELDLSARKLTTQNPLNPTKLSSKSYKMSELDIDIWETDKNFGISVVERVTSCFCMTSGIERDYVFTNQADRSRFCSLIHSVMTGVIPEGAIEDASPASPSSPGSQKPCRLFVTTWNMGNASWHDNLSGDWLPDDGSVDIFVIGTQESKLGAGDKTGQLGTGARTWFKALAEAMGPDYVAVAKRNMFQNYLYVAVRKELAQAVSHVETFQAEQGIASVWGNKGGTAVALRFNGQKMAFVNCHLAAHAEKVEKRKEDIKNIIRDVHFGNYNKVEFVTQYSVFWIGDLNFRVDTDMATAIKACKDGASGLVELAKEDQLIKEMAKGLMAGFVEGALTFQPTYKFDPMDAVPKTRREFTDHKGRTPSWTDRVLVRALDGHDIQQVAYDASPNIVSSDHEPVFGIYDFEAPAIKMSGNYRRFLLILNSLELQGVVGEDGETVDEIENMILTVNFPFLDDIRNGVKFKHEIRLSEGAGGSMVNKNTFKLGPFVTTSEFFRRQHVTMRIKDDFDRLGTVSVSIGQAVDTMEAYSFKADITKRSYRRATLSGNIIIKVAGGLEDGDDMAMADGEEDDGGCVLSDASEPEPETLPPLPPKSVDYEDTESDEEEE